MILLFYYLGGSGSFKHFAVLLTIYVLAFLMVSTVKFNSFKDLEPLRRRPFNTWWCSCSRAAPGGGTAGDDLRLVSAYIISGPVGEVVDAIRRRRTKHTESEKPVMGMTLTEKILARHAGRKRVSPGELILAKVDLALGNDVTSPIAIQAFRSLGAGAVFDRERIALVPTTSHRTRTSRAPNRSS